MLKVQWKLLNPVIQRPSPLLAELLIGVRLAGEKPDELAEKFGGFALSFSEFQQSLHLFDVILTSTGSDKTLINLKQVKDCMKQRPSKPLFSY